MTLHLAWFFRAPPGRRSALGNLRGRATRGGAFGGALCCSRIRHRTRGSDRAAGKLDRQPCPPTSCVSPARHTLPGSCSASIARRWTPTPRRHGARDPRRLPLSVGVVVIRRVTCDHRVSHRQQRARMDVARPRHADRTSAGMRAAAALDNRRARRIRVMRNCRRWSASLRRGWRA